MSSINAIYLKKTKYGLEIRIEFDRNTGDLAIYINKSRINIPISLNSGHVADELVFLDMQIELKVLQDLEF